MTQETARQGVTVLGATGSIGCSTLDVLARHPERFHVVALSAHGNLGLLARQCARHQVRYAVVSNADQAPELGRLLREAGSQAKILAGPEALETAVALPETDTVMAAIVGAAGLPSALAAARLGKRLLLANKESMVIAGELFARVTCESGGLIIPVDSEHNALFQSLPDGMSRDLDAAGVESLILTASGGPFRSTSGDELAAVTPEQACAHPNWDMGRKISVDSATLMNKGLEVIEARWLFNARPEQIQVVIHPQSIVHSLVAYRDGSVLAQMGMPDMRTPIAHALSWPQRIESGVQRLDLTQAGQLEFYPPDTGRFPCLALAFEAMAAGGDAPVTLNAANEVAVEAFLGGRIGFMDIPGVVRATLDRAVRGTTESLDAILESDRRARVLAREQLERHD